MFSLAILFLISCAACIHVTMAISGTATLTYYVIKNDKMCPCGVLFITFLFCSVVQISYAPCCPDNDNYDPNYPTTECDLYSACDYPGLFAALNGKQSLQYVQNHSLIAFFNRSDASNSHYHERHANKNITLVKDDQIFHAVIVDACGDTDCAGCCSANSADTGYLVDLEYYTALRFLGDVALATGTIDFYIDEVYPPIPPTDTPTGSPSPTPLQCNEGAQQFEVETTW